MKLHCVKFCRVEAARNNLDIFETCHGTKFAGILKNAKFMDQPIESWMPGSTSRRRKVQMVATRTPCQGIKRDTG